MAFGRTSTSRATRARAGVGGGVVVEGLDVVVSDFTREAATTRRRAEDVVVKHAGNAAQRMRDNVPVDRGDVLDSITSDSSATADGSTVYADAGPDMDENPAAFVARFLENGTVKMSPRPFVGPAADETIPEFERDIEDLPGL